MAGPMIASVILGAGASRRMRGADKLLEPVAGEPVIRRLARFAFAAGGPVAVTLPLPTASRRQAALDGLPLTRLEIGDCAEGMAASLRAAGAWAEGLGALGLLVCPGDMPALEAGDFAALAEAFLSDPATPLRAACGETPGHPVIFPARLLPHLQRLRGDEGGRRLLAEAPPRLLPLSGHRACLDLDTPEAWAEWRGPPCDCHPLAHS